jgi:hypothetical protein
MFAINPNVSNISISDLYLGFITPETVPALKSNYGLGNYIL